MFENIYQSKYKGKEVDSAIEKVLSNKFATQESLEQINTNKLDKGAKTSELINDGDGNSSFITEKKTSELLEEINNNLINKVDKEEGKGLSTNDFTNDEKNKLAYLQNYDDSAIYEELENISSKLSEKQNIVNYIVDSEGIIQLDGKHMYYSIDFGNDSGESAHIFLDPSSSNFLGEGDEYTFYVYIKIGEVTNDYIVSLGFTFVGGDITWLEEPTIEYPCTETLFAFQTTDGGDSWIANQCYSLEVTE